MCSYLTIRITVSPSVQNDPCMSIEEQVTSTDAQRFYFVITFSFYCRWNPVIRCISVTIVNIPFTKKPKDKLSPWRAS